MGNLLWLVLTVALGFGSTSHSAAAQSPTVPDTIAVTVGSVTLRGLLWRPSGKGPFPAVMFSHGSHGTAEPMPESEPGVLGPVFARHGYIFLFLFRQGIGLSLGQGTAAGDLMARAFAAEGIAGRNRVQLELLEGEELYEALAGLASLSRDIRSARPSHSYSRHGTR